MARKVSVMRGGQSAGAASKIVGTDSWGANNGAGLTAAGSSQATALQLSDDVNHIGTTAASTGVILPTADISVGDHCLVFNGGANTLSVYPDGTNTINGGSASAAVTLAANKAGHFWKTSPTNWAYVVSS